MVRDGFIESSVAPSGDGWVTRFDRCFAAAKTVTYATDDAFLADDVLYRYGTELAMGLALLRGRYLDAEVRQLAVWDGGPANGRRGTAIDVATWRRGNRAVTVVEPLAARSTRLERTTPAATASDGGPSFTAVRRRERLLQADGRGTAAIRHARAGGLRVAVLDDYGEASSTETPGVTGSTWC